MQFLYVITAIRKSHIKADYSAIKEGKKCSLWMLLLLLKLDHAFISNLFSTYNYSYLFAIKQAFFTAIKIAIYSAFCESQFITNYFTAIKIAIYSAFCEPQFIAHYFTAIQGAVYTAFCEP